MLKTVTSLNYQTFLSDGRFITLMIFFIIFLIVFAFNRFLKVDGDGREMFEGTINWVIFGVALALIPIFIDSVIQYTKSGSINSVTLVEDGQLAIISLGIAASAAGRLSIGHTSPQINLWQQIILFFTLLTILAAGAIYAVIVLDEDINSILILYLSINVFILSAGVGAISVFLKGSSSKRKVPEGDQIFSE